MRCLYGRSVEFSERRRTINTWGDGGMVGVQVDFLGLRLHFFRASSLESLNH